MEDKLHLFYKSYVSSCSLCSVCFEASTSVTQLILSLDMHVYIMHKNIHKLINSILNTDTDSAEKNKPRHNLTNFHFFFLISLFSSSIDVYCRLS